MEPVTQNDFSGGMTAAADSSKTPRDAVRSILSGRARKNSIVGAFKPVKIETPNLVHQAIFAADADLVVVIGGQCYALDGTSLSKLTGVPTMSATADVVYHEDVPAPTNFLQTVEGVDQYNPTVATSPECTVLQDGVNQPVLYHSGRTGRRAKTYAEWTFGAPEYVPIGKQMCESGNKLFVLSPDGRRIYQSVSGRPLDFVININNAGQKRGDADTTYLAVAAAQATALQAAQNGAYLAFTNYKAYAGVPDPVRKTIFGEVQIIPQKLFPVGAVSQNAFTISNGQSLFVSPQGIQMFDQVAQLDNASSLSPFGTPIIDFIKRPITAAATCTADDYTFFGLETIFGDGILVYDNRLSAFTSIDLVGKVKEFAVVMQNGLARVFFITYANELYELPLYNGERSTYSVYLGETTAGPHTAIEVKRVILGFNNVKAAGTVTAELFADKKRAASQTLTLTPDFNTDKITTQVPVNFPLEGEDTAKVLTFDVNTPEAFSVGLAITVSADAALVSAAVELNTPTKTQASNEVLETEETFTAVGDIGSDVNFNDQCTEALIPGQRYVFVAPSGSAELLNGDEKITASEAVPARCFVAKADRFYASDAAQVFGYSTFEQIINGDNDKLILLGDLGYSPYYDGIKKVLAWHGYTGDDIIALSGDNDRSTPDQLKRFNAAFGRPTYYRVETATCNFLVFNQTPAAENSAAENWLKVNTSNSKFNIVCFHESPYNSSITGEATTLRWNFRKRNIHLVLSANSNSYQRTYQNGVYYLAVGTGNPRGLSTNPNGLLVNGGLVMRASRARLRCQFVSTDGNVRDEIAIAL